MTVWRYEGEFERDTFSNAWGTVFDCDGLLEEEADWIEENYGKSYLDMTDDEIDEVIEELLTTRYHFVEDEVSDEFYEWRSAS